MRTELLRPTLIAAMVYGLAACGGGGGGDSVSLPDDGDDSTVGDGTIADLDTRVAAAYTLEVVGQLSEVADVSAEALSEGVTPLTARAVTVRAETGTESCDVTGSIDYTWEDNDNDGVLSIGDVTHVDFVNCVTGEEDDLGNLVDTTTINGSLRATAEAVGTTNARWAVEYTALEIDDAVVDGNGSLLVNVEDTTATIRMLGGPLDITYSDDSGDIRSTLTGMDFKNIYDLATGSYRLTPDASVAGNVLGSGVSFVMTTVLVFQGEEGEWPFTGELDAVSSDGSGLTLTALDSDTVRVTSGGTSTDVSWDDLDDELGDSDDSVDTDTDTDTDTTTDTDTDTDSDTTTDTDTDTDSSTDVTGKSVYDDNCLSCHADPSRFGASSGWPDTFLADLGDGDSLDFGIYNVGMVNLVLQAQQVRNLATYLNSL